MRILYKTPATERTLKIAERPITFRPSGTPGYLAAEVTDEAQLRILLSQRNGNLFSQDTAAVPLPALTRTPVAPVAPVVATPPPVIAPEPPAIAVPPPVIAPPAPVLAPVPPVDAPPAPDAPPPPSTPPPPEAGATGEHDVTGALALLDMTVREIKLHLPSVTSIPNIRLAMQIEAAKTDPRNTLIAELDKRLNQLNNPA